jgi:hypothetical protein
MTPRAKVQLSPDNLLNGRALMGILRNDSSGTAEYASVRAHPRASPIIPIRTRSLVATNEPREHGRELRCKRRELSRTRRNAKAQAPVFVFRFHCLMEKYASVSTVDRELNIKYS